MTRTSLRELTAYAAAKINIGWRVGSLRPDGFHEVCGTMQTISLCDRLHVAATETGTGTRCDVGGEPLWLSVSGAEAIEGEDNLVVRAARVLAVRVPPRPVAVTLEKVIPVAAGLGGGSADAAATLAALNVLWEGRLSARQLLELGAEVGSDVPAITLGGLVHVSGRGEIVRKLGTATGGAFVLGIGDEHIAAADAYARADELGRPTPIISSFHQNDLAAAARSLVVDLEERLEAMEAAGGRPAFVSGSGPTVVGVATNAGRAEELAAKVKSLFALVVVAHPVDWGTRVRVGAPIEEP